MKCLDQIQWRSGDGDNEGHLVGKGCSEYEAEVYK